MNKKELIQSMLEDIKATEINFIDVSSITNIADFMVIATVESTRQSKAFGQEIEKNKKNPLLSFLGIEGMTDGEWVLADLNDMIVHVMTKETRAYYNLDSLWSTEKNSE